jgi:hypothetical protein
MSAVCIARHQQLRALNAMAETRSPIEFVALTGGAMNLRLLVDESGLLLTPDISLRRNK